MRLSPQDLEQWLSHLQTLVHGLNLLDPDQLPSSFGKEVLGPVQEGRANLERLRRQGRISLLMRSLSELTLVAEERAWFFWEKAGRLLSAFVRAEMCTFYRQGPAGVLHKIHPLESEEDAVELSWPHGRDGDLLAVEEEGHAQTFLLRLGSRGRRPIVAKFQTIKPVPPMLRDHLAVLNEHAQAIFLLVADRLPKMETTRPMTLVAVPDEDADEGKRIYGQDPGLIKAIEAAEQAAQSEATVYFHGESGTGKELFAKHLHRLSARDAGPFIPINCSAIPQELIESEMFGHEKGAFTGAYYRKIGKVEQADGGTLFLDEIGEMPLPFQAKLLRYLQDKQFNRVGGNKPIHSDARIVVATHRDLREMVAKRSFREDLYYRIHVIPIDIPPLRKRGGDVRYLSELFFKKFITKSRASRRKVDPTVFDILERYAYPGNVRELENIIQRTVVMAQKSVISAEDLPSELLSEENEDIYQFRLHPFEKFDGFLPKDRATLKKLKKEISHVAFSYERDLDRRFLLYLLDKGGGSARKAAELASINRTLFYKLLKRAGLDIGLLNKDEG